MRKGCVCSRRWTKFDASQAQSYTFTALAENKHANISHAAIKQTVWEGSSRPGSEPKRTIRMLEIGLSGSRHPGLRIDMHGRRRGQVHMDEKKWQQWQQTASQSRDA
jgi:hypothetical protein